MWSHTQIIHTEHRAAAEREMEAVFEEARAAGWPPAATAFDDVLDTAAAPEGGATAEGAAG